VVQVVGEDPRDKLPFTDWLSRETPPGYPRAIGHRHRPLLLGFRGTRIGGCMLRILYLFWNIIRETALLVTHYFRVSW